MLSNKIIRNLEKPSQGYVRHIDSDGLGLHVYASGKMSWFLRLRLNGKDSLTKLGEYPVMTLEQARIVSADKKTFLKTGIAPASEKTFTEFCDTYFEMRSNLKKASPTAIETAKRCVKNHVLPVIGNKTVGIISALECIALIQNVAKRCPDTARRLGRTLFDIFDFAVDLTYCSSNPAKHLAKYLPPAEYTHMPAMLEENDIRSLFADCVGYAQLKKTNQTTCNALQFQALTAVRSGNIRTMQWNHVNFEKHFWEIPADLMKTDKPFRCPLSDQAISLLKNQFEITGNPKNPNEFVFGNGKGRPISQATLLFAFKKINAKAVPHGWRTSFSSWANDAVKYHPAVEYDPDAIELSLAHVLPGGSIRGSYNRSSYWESRVNLMQDWANFLTANNAETKSCAVDLLPEDHALADHAEDHVEALADNQDAPADASDAPQEPTLTQDQQWELKCEEYRAKTRQDIIEGLENGSLDIRIENDNFIVKKVATPAQEPTTQNLATMNTAPEKRSPRRIKLSQDDLKNAEQKQNIPPAESTKQNQLAADLANSPDELTLLEIILQLKNQDSSLCKHFVSQFTSIMKSKLHVININKEIAAMHKNDPDY